MGNQNELTGNILVAHGRLCKPLRTETSPVTGLWHIRELLEQLHGRSSLRRWLLKHLLGLSQAAPVAEKQAAVSVSVDCSGEGYVTRRPGSVF